MKDPSERMFDDALQQAETLYDECKKWLDVAQTLSERFDFELPPWVLTILATEDTDYDQVFLPPDTSYEDQLLYILRTFFPGGASTPVVTEKWDEFAEVANLPEKSKRQRRHAFDKLERARKIKRIDGPNKKFNYWRATPEDTRKVVTAKVSKSLPPMTTRVLNYFHAHPKVAEPIQVDRELRKEDPTIRGAHTAQTLAQLSDPKDGRIGRHLYPDSTVNKYGLPEWKHTNPELGFKWEYLTDELKELAGVDTGDIFEAFKDTFGDAPEQDEDTQRQGEASGGMARTVRHRT